MNKDKLLTVDNHQKILENAKWYYGSCGNIRHWACQATEDIVGTCIKCGTFTCYNCLSVEQKVNVRYEKMAGNKKYKPLTAKPDQWGNWYWVVANEPLEHRKRSKHSYHCCPYWNMLSYSRVRMEDMKEAKKKALVSIQKDKEEFELYSKTIKQPAWTVSSGKYFKDNDCGVSCDHCKKTKKVFRIFKVDYKNSEWKWVCVNHASNYNIKGKWENWKTELKETVEIREVQVNK